MEGFAELQGGLEDRKDIQEKIITTKKKTAKSTLASINLCIDRRVYI